MASTSEYEQQQFWSKTRNQALLEIINNPDNIRLINEFYKNYKLKHSKLINRK